MIASSQKWKLVGSTPRCQLQVSQTENLLITDMELEEVLNHNYVNANNDE